MRLVCGLLAAAQFLMPAPTRYRFSYELQGAARGHILLIIPYRAFYRSRASALFRRLQGNGGSASYVLDSIDETGIMVRTTGFTGRTLVILTADTDRGRGTRNGREYWQRLRRTMPVYPGFVRRVKDFSFRFFAPPARGLRFQRTPDGIQGNVEFSMDVRYQYYPEELRINFNLYRIMSEMLRLFDHSARPPLEAVPAAPTGGIWGCWVSPPLDYSARINAIAGLASRFVGSLKAFRQAAPFHLVYRLEPSPPGEIHINGRAAPGVAIWGRFRITEFQRRIVLRSPGGELLLDELQARITKGPGGGMTVHAVLALQDGRP